MCAVFGALVWRLSTPDRVSKVNEILNHIYEASHQRGRDGRGYVVISSSMTTPVSHRATTRGSGPEWGQLASIGGPCHSAVVIGNTRAEPTTEYVHAKRICDQQPYNVGHQWAVHNGTIANDRELRTLAHPSRIDSAVIPELLHNEEQLSIDYFNRVIEKLKGSYAILAADDRWPNELCVAVNYRPVWYVETEFGVFFASCRTYFPEGMVPVMLEPYTNAVFHWDGALSIAVTDTRKPRENAPRALVVCSGGLDSVVAATMAKQELGLDIELVHFLYGSRAQGPEVVAVQAAGACLGVPVHLVPLPVYEPGDSPLLRADSAIAGGEVGAEFAHEWVPARNLLLLSVATAIAEARGFEYLVLGNNLEEAGAYPDNEPEFIAKFNDLLPFAVGDGKRMKVLMPVGNMMKHEIVAKGVQLGAPLHVTWSCYRAGELHCGKCGPCFMRRKAFEINGAQEVIDYQE